MSSKNKTRTKDKYRVVYNDTQRIELENEFRLNEYIAIPRKQEIAQKLQLSERQIKIWFQNRRAKKRKQQKRRSVISCANSNNNNSPSSTANNQTSAYLASTNVLNGHNNHLPHHHHHNHNHNHNNHNLSGGSSQNSPERFTNIQSHFPVSANANEHSVTSSSASNSSLVDITATALTGVIHPQHHQNLPHQAQHQFVPTSFMNPQQQQTQTTQSEVVSNAAATLAAAAAAAATGHNNGADRIKVSNSPPATVANSVQATGIASVQHQQAIAASVTPNGGDLLPIKIEQSASTSTPISSYQLHAQHHLHQQHQHHNQQHQSQHHHHLQQQQQATQHQSYQHQTSQQYHHNQQQQQQQQLHQHHQAHPHHTQHPQSHHPHTHHHAYHNHQYNGLSSAIQQHHHNNHNHHHHSQLMFEQSYASAMASAVGADQQSVGSPSEQQTLIAPIGK